MLIRINILYRVEKGGCTRVQPDPMLMHHITRWKFLIRRPLLDPVGKDDVFLFDDIVCGNCRNKVEEAGVERGRGRKRP